MSVQKKTGYSFRRPRYMSEYEYARKIHQEYTNAKTHDAKNFDRCLQNNRLYWAVDTDKGLGQIPSAVVSEMIRIGKQPGAYNICRPTVDNIVGGFLQNRVGFDFRPVDGEMTSLTYTARDVIFSESELMDWNATDSDGMIDGCIYRADHQMYIDKRYKPNNHINWRVLPPGEVVWPPKLSSKHHERRKVYRRRMMTPMDMLEYFSGSREKIIKSVMYKKFGEKYLEELAKLQEQTGEEYGANSGVVPFSNNDEMWGSEYEVIMFYHMETVTRTFEYVFTEDGEKLEIPSDLTSPNATDEEKAQAKILWLDQNAPGWMAKAVFADDEDSNIQYLTVICPSLANNLLLCDGPTEVQCGMLEIAPWSAYFKNGEFGGIIDSIKDIQLSLNWIQNTLQYRLHVDGEGTSWYVFPEAFITPEEYQRWVDCKNKAGEVFAMKPGMEQKYPNGPAVPVSKSPYPREATDRLEHLIDKLLPLIGKYTPASRGQTESSGESGYLFNLKKLQNDVERMVLYESRRNFKNLQGEMWLNQAIITHGNKIARKFFNTRTGGTFTINERITEKTASGEMIEYILNDMSKLKEIRHRVIVVDSPDSPTRKAEDMQIASEQLSGIQNPNAVPVSYVSLTHSMLRGAQNLSEDEERRQEEYFEIEMELAMQTAKTQIAQQKLAEVQALSQMQPQGAPAPVPGGTGGGVPSGDGGMPGSVPQPGPEIPQAAPQPTIPSGTFADSVYSGVEEGQMAGAMA